MIVGVTSDFAAHFVCGSTVNETCLNQLVHRVFLRFDSQIPALRFLLWRSSPVAFPFDPAHPDLHG